ncbi:SH3 domain-containing protein [Curvibacter sp. APW13]|uniref:SH3 domain-containing protein n=1 Tax=Curvibacter sp. APW13 TaxID=3077236 RepID=UPI0028DDF89F|nr:SH3 domain-containing protein [Curvibacter sp. APW13]MDT8992070.1 SH3 domain-containing protein [Curvibacter sp. APW13]
MKPRLPRTASATALCAALLATTPLAQAQNEPLQTKQATALRDQPSATGATLATLPAGTSVTRTTQRTGPWMQVQTATGQTGWVHMFDVSAGGAAAPASNGLTGALRGLSGFLNRGSSAGSTTTATSTIGIRGLSKEDIQNAAPNLAAVDKLEQMRADEAQARRYASERHLAAQTVALLPTPNPPAAPTSPGGSFQKEGK